MANIARAKKGFPVHMKYSNLLWQERDRRIKNAQDNMKTEKPWCVQTFLDEVADIEWDPTFAIIDQGHLNFIHYSTIVFISFI